MKVQKLEQTSGFVVYDLDGAETVELGLHVPVEWRQRKTPEIAGIEVVPESSPGDLAGAHAAAHFGRSFEDEGTPAGACERKGADEAIRPGADHDRIEICHAPTPGFAGSAKLIRPCRIAPSKQRTRVLSGA